MKVIKLISVLLFFFLLYGCDRQKSHQEVIEDLNKIKTRYKKCLISGVAKKGDTFCQNVLDAPEDIDELLRLAITDPQELGDKVLKLQQEIGELKQSSEPKDKTELKLKSIQLKRCYLILKLLSSIK